MSDITNCPQQHIPAPQLERKNHVPSVGDIYFDRTRIIRLVSISGSSYFDAEAYEFSSGTWKKSYSRSVSELADYYRLLLCDFDDAVRTAKAAVDGDASALNGVLASRDIPAEPGALVAGTDKASILALTVETVDRLMSDRTQRTYFRSWMPLLQRTRKELLKEAGDERAFAALIQQEVSRRGGPECQDTIREAIAWWKSKLTAPTAKAVGFRRKAKPSFWCRLDSVRCCGCRECHCAPCVRG